MNIADTADLLTAIATRDQRTVGQADIAAWSTDLADVTFDEGMAAVTAFHQSEVAQRRRIVAADIVQWTIARRRRERQVDAVRDVHADVVAHRQITARVGELHEAWHVESLEVACPPRPLGCGRSVGERCGHDRMDGGWVVAKIPHPSRSMLARDARLARGEASAFS